MRHILLSCVAAVVLLAGCAAPPEVKLYNGPVRAGKELATLVVPYQFEISSINGVGIPWRSGLRSADAQAYKLLPGRYTFHLRFTSPFEFGTERGGVSTLPMLRIADLEAGRTYSFKAKVKGDDQTTAEVEIWLEDTASRQQVDQLVSDTAPTPGTSRPMAPEPVTPDPIPLPEPEPVPAEAAPAPEVAPDTESAPTAEPGQTPPAEAAPAHVEAAPSPKETEPAPAASPSEQLKQSWESATPEERAEFLKHITK